MRTSEPKKRAELGDGMCLYEREDGTVYIAPEKEQEEDLLEELLQNEQ